MWGTPVVLEPTRLSQPLTASPQGKEELSAAMMDIIWSSKSSDVSRLPWLQLRGPPRQL